MAMYELDHAQLQFVVGGSGRGETAGAEDGIIHGGFAKDGVIHGGAAEDGIIHGGLARDGIIFGD